MRHRCIVQNLPKLQECELPQKALSYYSISMSAHKKISFKVGITVDLGATGGPSFAGATFLFDRRTLCAFFLTIRITGRYRGFFFSITSLVITQGFQSITSLALNHSPYLFCQAHRGNFILFFELSALPI